ncbi:MAG: histidine kinase, partial [Bacillota bacterium]|nr:histidine kinase [Bacillota bacterium]
MKIRKVIKVIDKKYKNTTLSNKIIIAMSFAFIILFSLVITFNEYRTINIFTKQQSSLSEEILDMKSQNFLTYCNQLENYTLQLRNDDNFMQLITLKDMDYSGDLYIQNAFKNMFYTRRDISELKLYLINENKNYTISKQYQNVRTSVNPDFSKSREFTEASKYPSYKYTTASGNSSNTFLKIYRAIINIQNQKTLAYVEITVDTSYIQNLANTNSPNQYTFSLLDKQGNLYYTNNKDIVRQNTLSGILSSKINLKNSASDKLEGSFFNPIDKINYLFIYSVYKDANWVLVNITPASIVKKSALETRNITVIISIIALIIAMLSIFTLTKTLLKPLKKLASQMDKAGEGDFGATIDVKGSAEIKNLESKFNSMLRKIDELIEKNYISELNEKTAKLKALEAQINPHFLYNTLQVISTQAIINGQKDISRMIKALSSILRYSIIDNDLVPLDSEIKNVQAYLLLQKARFDERLSYNFNIESKIGDLLLPKISIMSLVENSIKHGMETTYENIEINVDVMLRQGYLVVLVKDNGAGMTPEKLEYVRNQISESAQGQNIGLSNLSGRLKILYNNLASINIESS